jgi:hypothetical protein
VFLAAAPAALNQSAGYVAAMSNPYGIALDREWSEWAAKFGASTQSRLASKAGRANTEAA